MELKFSNLVLAVFVLLLSGLSRADSITLRDGHHVQGKFAGGTQGVIAFSVGCATQYYDVNNVLVMTFEGEGSDAQEPPRQDQIPSIIPEPGSIQRQKLQGKSESAKTKLAQRGKPQQKRSARLVMAAQRSE